MFRSSAAGILGLTAALAATAAHAATLDAVQGAVFVNSGYGYHQVGGTTELNPGDQVMANAGGSAQVVYPDGCKVTLEAGQVVAVAAQSPCSIETGSVPDGGGVDGTTLLVGGLVVGGAVGAAVLLSDDDDDNGNGNGSGGGGGGGPPPASP